MDKELRKSWLSECIDQGNKGRLVSITPMTLRSVIDLCSRYEEALHDVVVMSMRGGGDYESVARTALTQICR